MTHQAYHIAHKCSLQPLHADLLDLDPRGICWLYEPPSPGATYAMGIDVSGGIQGWSRYARSDSDYKTDNGAIEIVRKGKGDLCKGCSYPSFACSRGTRHFWPSVQVAEYAAPLDPFELAGVANALGRLYAGQDDNGQCLSIIEVQPGQGFATQREMMNRFGYTNQYVWTHLDKITPTPSTSYGWVSSRTTVPYLWTKASRIIQRHEVVINSEALVEEMANCSINAHGWGEAQSPNHDDRVRALMLALWGLHAWSFDVETDSTPAREGQGSGNWQAQGVSCERMYEQWEELVSSWDDD